ncbi:MAG: sulfotransferase [Novosphingobium sp.]|nr:sulfotransferase [Novosphingobium sp.]
MLTVENIVERAREQTGLTEFGDTAFLEPMGIFFESLNREAGLSERGEAGMTASHTRNLVNLLRAEYTFRKDPAILDATLPPPVFITGLPRTGTTALHRMMSADGRFSFLPTWLAMNPAPFPDAAPGMPDPRIAIADAEEDMLRQHVPAVYAAHPYRAREAEEELFYLRYSYRTYALQTYTYTPSYGAWLKGQDQRPAYDGLRRMLQLVQSQQTFPDASHFLLKSPFHLGQLDHLFAVFPDARVIICHREPSEVFASWANMLINLHYLNSERVDAAAIASYWTDKLIEMLDNFVKKRPALHAGQVLDMHYRDIVGPPGAGMERVYDFIGLPFTGEYRDRVCGWKETNPQHGFGKHSYDMDALPLDLDRIRADTRAYTDQYVSH